MVISLHSRGSGISCRDLVRSVIRGTCGATDSQKNIVSH
jgi:hypothetical protein